LEYPHESQFESSLFKSLSCLLGVQRIRTTPYHPQANGLIEELHRPLKAAIKAYNTEHWSDALPTILLGFRVVFKETIQATISELVYGKTIRLPGEFFEATTSDMPPKQLVEDLREHFAYIRPTPTSNHGNKKVFVHPKLYDCTHVFLRIDKVTKPLQAPYDGPYKVLLRREKTFKIAINNRVVDVSVDRLKPAYYCATDNETSSNTTVQPVVNNNNLTPPSTTTPDSPQTTAKSPTTVPTSTLAKPPRTVITRSGRHVRFNPRYL